ncbi:MAG TPA: DUF86 domain-containing protein [Methanocorpusculum sp.]|nr:DUF86 domain-containing protein [Methanocorpusculum sp.]
MVEQIEFIQSGLAHISREEFFTRALYQNAFIRSLELIGEAAKGIDDDYRALHPEVPWKSMAGMRDKLIHCYATIDLEEVWNTLTVDIGPLYSELKHLL